MASVSAPKTQNMKSCKFFAAGACKRGTACAYAHGGQDSFSNSSNSNPKPSGRKYGRDRKTRGSPIVEPEVESESHSPAAMSMAGLTLKHVSYEQAALKLMMSFLPRPRVPFPPMDQEDLDCKKGDDLDLPFSRQSTWEGVADSASSFSRLTTEDEPDSPTSPKEEPDMEAPARFGSETPLWDSEIQVKNTFVQMEDRSQVTFRRSQSAPYF
ncbi:unnamed protein product [Effrenium voratum]|nr:unnamed protein product [Effrenium voratum]